MRTATQTLHVPNLPLDGHRPEEPTYLRLAAASTILVSPTLGTRYHHIDEADSNENR